MGLPKSILTEDEYLKFERAAEERHIYVDGEISAMAGESGGARRHHRECVRVPSQSTRRFAVPRTHGEHQGSKRSAA